jgi:hypothetical protein
MTLYENGKSFRLAIILEPPDELRVPCTVVNMAIPDGGKYVQVIGRVDSGAFITGLRMDTAANLGIRDPKRGYVRRFTGHTANGEAMQFYVHEVLVKVTSTDGESMSFVIYPGFAEGLRLNLFGRDWLDHFCFAIDCSRVHLLRD